VASAISVAAASSVPVRPAAAGAREASGMKRFQHCLTGREAVDGDSVIPRAGLQLGGREIGVIR